MQRLTIVLVTYQSAEVLPDCLRALVAVRGEVDDLELVVVDNCSTDRPEQVVDSIWPGALFLQTGKNAGYAAAFNLGCRQSRSGGPVLLLNPDAQVRPHALPAMLAALARPGVGVVVPRLLDEHDNLALSLRRDPTALRAWGQAILGARADRFPSLSEVVASTSHYEQPSDVEWASGAAMLMSRTCLEESGPWDESFFLYSEETDFCLRARDHGFTIRYEPSAAVTHLGGECLTDPVLWSILSVNRVRLARRRLAAAPALSFAVAVLANEALRSVAGRPTARAALRALVRPASRPQALRSAQRQGARSPGGPVVCFSAQDFWYHNRAHSDVQLMTRLSEDRPVLLVNSIGMRMPLPGRTSQPLRRIARKAASTSRLLRRPLSNYPDFAVLSPVILPFYGSALGRRLNALAVGLQVNLTCRVLRMQRPTVVVTIPTAVDVLPHLNAAGVVFNHSDKHSEFDETDQALIGQMEDRLLGLADRVLYVSHQLLLDETEKAGDRAFFLDHGVDPGHFHPQSAHDGPEPTELRAVPRPRIGFFGGLDDYVVDIALLEQVAREIPTAQLVLIGDATCDLSGLEALPNVTILSRRPYEEIPAYGRAFDVALMPWLDNDWIRNCNPIKLKEYLALGLPVVSTDFPEVRLYRDVVAIAGSPDDFVDLVRRALAGDSPGTVATRRAAVEACTWDALARKLGAVCDDVSAA